ncbi:hypothetical protein ACQJBY_060239 [Aegilops geniculata]
MHGFARLHGKKSQIMDHMVGQVDLQPPRRSTLHGGAALAPPSAARIAAAQAAADVDAIGWAECPIGCVTAFSAFADPPDPVEPMPPPAHHMLVLAVPLRRPRSKRTRTSPYQRPASAASNTAKVKEEGGGGGVMEGEGEVMEGEGEDMSLATPSPPRWMRSPTPPPSPTPRPETVVPPPLWMRSPTPPPPPPSPTPRPQTVVPPPSPPCRAQPDLEPTLSRPPGFGSPPEPCRSRPMLEPILPTPPPPPGFRLAAGTMQEPAYVGADATHTTTTRLRPADATMLEPAYAGAASYPTTRLRFAPGGAASSAPFLGLADATAVGPRSTYVHAASSACRSRTTLALADVAVLSGTVLGRAGASALALVTSTAALGTTSYAAPAAATMGLHEAVCTSYAAATSAAF